MRYKILISVLFVGLQSVYGQTPPLNIANKPYYIDMKSGSKEVNAIDRGFINLLYQDKTGDKNPLELKVFGWEGNEVAQYSLSKSYGSNYYTISLKDYYEEWQIGEVYRFVVADKKAGKFTIVVRKTETNKENPPMPDILVNPINLDCDGLEGSTMDFYGAISGGKPPYKISWFIMDESRANLLYQPQEETIENVGNTSTIRVDINPEYHVMLSVIDACGNEGEQILNIKCPEGKTRISSLFFSPIKPLRWRSKLEK